MSRSKSVVLAALVLAGVSLVALPAFAAEPGVQELSNKVAALEKRVAAMEAAMAQLSAAGGGAPNAALESEADAAFGRINQLVASGNMADAKTQMDGFMQKYGATQAATKARRLYQELVVIGKSSPGDWGAIEKWYQGEDAVDLTGDKTTLLVFWEVWCPHCKREVPKLDQMYSSLKGDGLQIVGLTKLSRNTTEESLASFLDTSGVTYPIAKENGSLSSYFNVSGVPAAAVIKNGKVIWRGHPARLSEATLKGWL